MDRISLLSDDVILKILSFAPTKVAVTTSLLSKRWSDLWKHVARLEYCDPKIDTEQWRASSFVHNFLLLHKAPILETLHLRLSRNCRLTDIETWIRIAIARGVRDLLFGQYVPSLGPNIRLPRSLYTCESLVTLSLHYAIIVDVPLTMCFRSLRALLLAFVNFSSDETVHRLLSGCPVLEDLKVIRRGNDNVKTFTIMVPSLQRLQVLDLKFGDQVPGDDFESVIKAPSLNSLTINNQFCSLVNMRKLVKANIKLPHGDSKKLLGCLTSAKLLSLCVKQPMESYPIGVFYQLVYLSLCTCSSDWFRLILRHTPKLRALRFQLQEKLLPNLTNVKRYCNSSGDVQTQWERPSSIPQCLISSLETVEWIGYKGTEAEKKVVVYLLENSGQLKTMAIRPLKSTNLEKKHKMLQELSSTRRSSSKCRVSFT